MAADGLVAVALITLGRAWPFVVAVFSDLSETVADDVVDSRDEAFDDVRGMLGRRIPFVVGAFRIRSDALAADEAVALDAARGTFGRLIPFVLGVFNAFSGIDVDDTVGIRVIEVFEAVSGWLGRLKPFVAVAVVALFAAVAATVDEAFDMTEGVLEPRVSFRTMVLAV